MRKRPADSEKESLLQSPDPLLDCDVIVVNYNAGEMLGSCVSSALAEGARRVIVVDNGSRDDSLTYLEKELPRQERLAIIRNGDNFGFAKACNIGVGVSTSRHLFFLNPDCILAPGSLRRMITVLESDHAIGMVGGLLCNQDGSEQPGGRRAFPTPRRAFVRAFGLSRLAAIFPDLMADFRLHAEPLPAAPAIVEAISGACMLVKREAMDDVGLWDEGYFLHCEDLDWCMRFHQKGWQVVFVPDARVFHAWRACSRSRPIFVEWHKHKGMLRFYRKFFRHQYHGLLWVLVLVGVWVRFPIMAGYYSFRRLAGFLGSRA
ncbi:MAG: glycosyltransferase family 2 protein [Desulfobacteraceae bacterium]|nr:MAG: glycosyltransferase family 2 protein [Desulfobacteraceae bacterium]